MGACKHGWECRFFGRGCVGLMEGLLVVVVVVRFLVREVESLSFFLQLWWIERFGAGNGSALVYGNCKSTAVSSQRSTSTSTKYPSAGFDMDFIPTFAVFSHRCHIAPGAK